MEKQRKSPDDSVRERGQDEPKDMLSQHVGGNLTPANLAFSSKCRCVWVDYD